MDRVQMFDGKRTITWSERKLLMVNAKMVALGITAGALGIFMAGTAALGGAQAGSSSAVGTESGERTIEDGGTGPYKAIAVSNSSIATHTIYRPKDLSAFGDKEKLPILAWGNGGCANSNSGHQNYLSEIASHGYLIVAKPSTGLPHRMQIPRAPTTARSTRRKLRCSAIRVAACRHWKLLPTRALRPYSSWTAGF
jgi:hypothetical protein